MRKRKIALLSGADIPIAYQDFTTNFVFPSWLDNSLTVGNRTLFDSTGALTYAPNNLLLNSATLSTQSVTVISGASYIVSFYGTGSITLSGAASATINGTGASNQVYQKVTASTTTLTLTVAGSVTSAVVACVTYETTPRSGDQVITTAAAYYGLRFDNTPATANSPLGLLIEGAATNSQRNSTMQGAVAGSPGTLFTNATSSGLGTLTQTLAIGTEYGMPYLDLRLSGTTSTTAFFLNLEGGTSVAASNGQKWVQSIYHRISAGALTNISQVDINVRANDGVGALLNSAQQTFTPSSSLTRTSVSLTNSNASTTYEQGYMAIRFSSGVAIDITLRIYQPQLEQSQFVTSPIPTYGSAVTRVADIIKLSGTALSAIGGSRGTVIQQWVPEGFPSSANQYGIYGNTVSPMYLTSGANIAKATNGTNVINSGVTPTVNTAFREGLAWDGSGRAISANGGAAVTDANSFGTIGSTVYVGSNNGATPLSGRLQGVSFYTTKVSSASLSSKTTVSAAY